MRTGLTLLAAGLMAGASAQGVITRISSDGTGTTFRYDGNIAAVLAELNPLGGDTVILGGGVYTPTTDLVINWPVVLIGSGIRPDSANPAYPARTEIRGGYDKDLFINANADGTELHGISFGSGNYFGWVQIGQTDLPSSDCDDVLFERCEIPQLAPGRGYQGSQANNVQIVECIIGELNTSYADHPRIWNSVIKYMHYTSPQTEVSNCIFLDFNQQGANDNNGVNYTNCVFLRNVTSTYTIGEQSTFSNNLFVGPSGFTVAYGTGVVQSGNLTSTILNTPPNGAFAAGGPTAYTCPWPNNQADVFPYTWNLHTGQNYLSKGIYSGPQPWKEGSLPFNPHWRELTTGGVTNNGILPNVIIKASAQEN